MNIFLIFLFGNSGFYLDTPQTSLTRSSRWHGLKWHIPLTCLNPLEITQHIDTLHFISVQTFVHMSNTFTSWSPSHYTFCDAFFVSHLISISVLHWYIILCDFRWSSEPPFCIPTQTRYSPEGHLFSFDTVTSSGPCFLFPASGHPTPPGRI
jgi:hypothetical protein